MAIRNVKKAVVKKAAKKSKPAAKEPAKAAKTARKPAAKPKAAASKPVLNKDGHPALDAEHQVPGGVFLGRVDDYFAHVGVVSLTLQAPVSVGDMIRIKGHTTDITQKVESLQINHQPAQTASAKDSIGIKVADRTRKSDAVYKI